jgi:hypothetical protein
VQRVISVTPLSLDLTSRADFAALDACMRGESAICLDLLEPWVLPVANLS